MRGQSHVLGVAILLGVSVVAMGSLTAIIGAVVEENAGHADATRVADSLDGAIDPVATTGTRRGQVSFTEGRLHTVERELRVLRDGRVVETLDANALVFASGRDRAAFAAGAVIRGGPGRADLHTPPPVTVGPETLIVGAPVINGTASVSGTGGVTVHLTTTVTHERRDLGNGTYAVAIETTTPRPWNETFHAKGATLSTRDFDGDGVDSVVATFDGERRAYLVVHDLALEVRHA
ncbi:DUF7289 family protein [Natronomonas sp. EA1]|uniref:DUF7289 family protein n=1 Tax=Natronomonas sp. EA1 TaxID=3421655 RepID=UPI003EB7B303